MTRRRANPPPPSMRMRDKKKEEACEHDIVPVPDDPEFGYCTKCDKDGFDLGETGVYTQLEIQGGEVAKLRKELEDKDVLLQAAIKERDAARIHVLNLWTHAEDRVDWFDGDATTARTAEAVPELIKEWGTEGARKTLKRGRRK